MLQPPPLPPPIRRAAPRVLVPEVPHGQPPLCIPDTKPCPFCAETIKAAAVRCRFCGANLAEGVPSEPRQMRLERTKDGGISIGVQVALALAGTGMLAGLLLPWVSVGIFSASGLQKMGDSALVNIAFGVAVLASSLVSFARKQDSFRWVSLVSGILGTAMAVLEWFALDAHLADSPSKLIHPSMGAGIYVCIASGIVAVIASLAALLRGWKTRGSVLASRHRWLRLFELGLVFLLIAGSCAALTLFVLFPMDEESKTERTAVDNKEPAPPPPVPTYVVPPFVVPLRLADKRGEVSRAGFTKVFFTINNDNSFPCSSASYRVVFLDSKDAILATDSVMAWNIAPHGSKTVQAMAADARVRSFRIEEIQVSCNAR